MNLIGKKVIITSRDSWVYDQWGTIIDFDGDSYHIALYDDKNLVLVFYRDEFRVPRGRKI